MSKGKLVGIEGKLRLDEYTNENGKQSIKNFLKRFKDFLKNLK